MASRLLTDLSPHIQQECTKHLKLCKDHGIDAFLTCTFRSAQEQDSLYHQGRKLILGKWVKIGRVVTNAMAGFSAHQFGLAYDLGIITNGKINWDASSPDWLLAGHLGESIYGIEWLGNPKSKFKESAHFQLIDWKKYKR